MDLNKMFRFIFRNKDGERYEYVDNPLGENGVEEELVINIPENSSAGEEGEAEKRTAQEGGQKKLLQISLVRYSQGAYDMLGKLYFNGHFQCFTLEGNIQGEEASEFLPEGIYDVGLLRKGGKNATYAYRYKEFHQGMLHIKKGKDFPFACIHEGNRFTDRKGSILVGMIPVHEEELALRRELWFSDEAYLKLYRELSRHIKQGGKVQLWIREEFQSLLPQSDVAA